MQNEIYIEGQGYIRLEGIDIKPCKFCNHIGIELDIDCDNEYEKPMQVVECGNNTCLFDGARPYSEAETVIKAIIKWNNGIVR